MTDSQRDPLHVIATLPPALTEDAVAALLARHYGLHGSLTPLVSERDQNFRVECGDGRRYVLKIANAAEDPVVTDFQIQALRHIEKSAERAEKRLTAPAVIPTIDGALLFETEYGEDRLGVRLLTYLDGVPLSGPPQNAASCRPMGRYLAHLGHALRGFAHPGENQVLLWDMQRALHLRRLLQFISDEKIRNAVGRALDDFEQHALPIFHQLRWQVIHADFHPDNILVAERGSDTVAGVIDFGDMLRSPLIVDVAVAAAYLRSPGDDPLRHIVQFVAGYNEIETLSDDELDILIDLIRTRIAATVSIYYWRASTRDENDPYLRENESSASDTNSFLIELGEIPTAAFAGRIRGASATD